jgi:hypothetical protein
MIGDMIHYMSIFCSLLKFILDAPTPTMPAPNIAPTIVCVLETGMPYQEEIIVKPKVLIVTASIMLFCIPTAASSILLMILLDKVLVTCFEHQYAPINSNIEPRTKHYIVDNAPLT